MTTPGRPSNDPPAGPVLPGVSLPTPGGAVRGLGEKFSANPVTGSASVAVPLTATAGRSGFGPQLTVGYDSAAGQSVFGYGWQADLPSITRQTERGVPKYTDQADVFLLAGGEDLVPVPGEETRTLDGVAYRVERYRPRIESDDARIERWSNIADRADVCWRVITQDNVTSWFGRTGESRITDPADPARIFSWLICRSHDDKGNVMVFDYKAEDGFNVDASALHERHRTELGRTAHRYLKRIRYGNVVPYYPATDDELPSDWHFELVLDYGEHDAASPTPDEIQPWPARSDPYSAYRAGFEIRTYRLCRRALMFHRFPELGDSPRLVLSTDFTHEVSAGYSFVTMVTRRGYDGDRVGALPSLTLTYQTAQVDEQVREVPNLPRGFDDATYFWVDLDGEGSAGVLAAHRDAWWYSRNVSALHDAPAFASAQPVPVLPGDGLASPLDFLVLDVDGSGAPGLIRLAGNRSAIARRGEDGSWLAAVAPAVMPSTQWRPDEVRLADLTGDGLPDLVADNEIGALWHECLGTRGFGAAMSLVDDATGAALPRLISRDRTELVQFADMTGDGLPDLVRIGNGTVRYQPNLGHGRFGAAVSTVDSPWFDTPELFDPRRLLLADVDGTGAVDLVYLAADGARLYLNHSGNRWALPRTLTGVPGADNLKRAAVVDLLGTGTACLVWSSPLPADTATPMRYVDLMGGVKPHLLTGYTNGMGAQVRVEYRPSTYFYLRDEAQGRPWPTRLPFPVQCAHRVTTIDHVRETLFINTTSYHDGYYDPREREFRGFGMVEALDTESYDSFGGAANAADPSLHQPPVLTRTWYHTGACGTVGQRLLHTRRDQYFQNTEWTEHEPPEPDLPPAMSDDEYAEAIRALKGVALRSEVYSLDGSPQEALPYSASEMSYEIRLLQHQGGNRNASFRVVPAETIAYSYDRTPADPRVTHSLALEVDELGMVRRSASVVYPRQTVDLMLSEQVRAAQARRHITYREHDYTADVSGPGTHRLRACFENRSYELMGLASPAGFLSRADLSTAVAAAIRVPYEQLTGDGTRLRLIERWRLAFLADDLSGPLPFGTQQSLGLIDRTYRLALTDGLVAGVYAGAVSNADLSSAGYVAGDGGWWVRSGNAVYPPDARDHFYLPNGYRDGFGLITTVEREHDLLTSRVTDPLGHATVARNDYRVMSPDRTTDPNGNHGSVRFDELGVVVAAAASGKGGEGDTLDDPTSTVEYDLFQQPARLIVRARERHGPANPRWQEMRVYLDGGGAAVMAKVEAPPDGGVPRWIGNGRTIFDNKGATVKQYEPYFSTTPEYESEAELVETGVTPVIRRDPIGRVVRADMPDGTFTRVEHGAWMSRGFDANDTVLDSMWYAERGAPPAAEPEPVDPQRRAAWLAAAHAGTASTMHFDSLGRVVLSIADNGPAGARQARSESDLTGHVLTVFDNRDRQVATAMTDMLGNALKAESAERGTRWMFFDVAGVPVRVWDSGRIFRTSFDAFRRPEATTCVHNGVESVVSRVVYGEAHPEAVQRNLLGVAHAVFDTAGKATLERADFQGRPVELTRRLTVDPESTVDWSGDPEALLEAQSHTVTAQYDALGRIERMTLADGTVMMPTYDVANRLATLAAQVRGAGAAQTFLAGEQYDAKGRRLAVELGNGAVTSYSYDPGSLRVNGVMTARAGNVLQDLAYFYDPVGNVTEIVDNAQQTHFFANAVVRPDSRFTYDAIYQLVQATGREHASLSQPDHADLAPAGLPHANDAAAVRRYTQNYSYDDLGNLTEMNHTVAGGGWTRRYQYAYEVNPADVTNRLVATSLPGDAPGAFGAAYQYDPGGNTIAMPQVASLSWDVFDRLGSADLGGGGSSHYSYGAGGGRARKVIQRQGGLRTERRYLGGAEVYREWMNGALRLERWTLHVSDAHGRIAQVDTLTVDTAGTDPAPLNTPVTRYQYTNHLGSSTLETDESGVVISYEEYHPFGTTAYRSSRPSAHHSLKRYRYGGNERDDETGLYYAGARYYAPWLGRWTSPDPAGLVDGPNLFAYCRNNPVTMVDPTGTQGRRHPYEYPELNQAMAADPGSFRPTGEVAASGREGHLRWRVLEHATFGRVWQYTGAVHGPLEVIVWGGPPLIRESDAFARWPGARVGRPETQPEEGDVTGPPGPAEREEPPPVAGGGGGDAPPAQESGPPAEGETAVSSAPHAGRLALEEAVRPRSVTGTRAQGTLHLWSGAQGKADARAAIGRSGGRGWMMGDIGGQPTPQHAAGEAEFAQARARAPGGQLTQAEFERIWGPRSANVVGRGAFAGHPVEAHGVAGPQSIQRLYEWPARAVGGGIRGPFVFGTGMFTAIVGGQDPNPAVAVPLVIAGVGEATSGIIYGSGAILGSAEAMAIGAAGATAFGGAAAVIGFGTASYRAHQAGDTAGTLAYAAGAIGGALLIASLFTPVGWVGLAGLGLVAFASGFGIGRWWRSR